MDEVLGTKGAPVSDADRSALERLVASAEGAWNAGDAAAYGAAFGERAGFVHVYGGAWSGRREIEEAHRFLFAGPFAGSTNAYRIEHVRPVTDDVACAQIEALLHVPAGPVAGERHARMTVVFARGKNGWTIEALHNTFITPMPALGRR